MTLITDYNILSQIFEKNKQMDVVQNAMFSKLNELVECNKVEKEEEDDEEQKKKLDEIFEKRKIGRPAGSLVEKQQQYFDLVCSGKVKSSVKKTLDYYQITLDETGKYIMNKFS
jgi:hypothetical protein